MILSRLFGRKEPEAIQPLLEALVACGRQPSLYAQGGVPDTLDGRFDMIGLVAFLVFRRLRREGEIGRTLAQAIYDRMFQDFEFSLREMGVSDVVIGKRVQAMTQAFSGRVAAYEDGLTARDSAALMEALRRNLYGTVQPTEPQLAAMTSYVHQVAATLDRLASDILLGGQLAWPAFSVAEEQ